MTAANNDVGGGAVALRAPSRHRFGGDQVHAVPLFFAPTLDLSLPDLMLPFHERPVVVLSPHFDDGCYSLGTFLAAVGRGTLINIFTQGRHLRRRWVREQLSQADIVAIRNFEDQIFARRCGLERLDLGCEEPALRGRQVRDLTKVEDDVEQITSPLLHCLAGVAAGFTGRQRGFLFAPLGVGFHCNHRAVTEVVLRHLGAISPRFDVMLYEDQPYSSSLWNRVKAIARIGRRLNTGFAARYMLARPWPEKRALISLYSSQLRNMPSRLRFWPRAVGSSGPHEAFWTFPLAQSSLRE